MKTPKPVSVTDQKVSRFNTILTMTLTLLCAIGGAAASDGNAVRDEAQDFLFQFEEAYTQQDGETQISILYDRAFEPRGSGASIEFEYGVTDRLEISAELPLTFGPGEAGAGDMEFGVDYALMLESGQAPALTIGVSASAPTGDAEEGRGVGGWSYETSLRASKQALDGLTIHLAGAYGWTPNGGAEGDSLTEWSIGAGGAIRASDRLTLIAEYLRESERIDEGGAVSHEVTSYLSAGSIFEIIEGVSLGAAGAAGVGGESADVRFLAKMQIEW